MGGEGGEEQGRGFDVAVDYALGVEVVESAEEGGEDWTEEGGRQGGVEGRGVGEEVGEGEGLVGEDEDEVLGGGVEGFEEGDDVWGGVEGLEDLGFAARVVRLDVVGFDDDFEGAGAGAVDLGCHAAGDVVAVLVVADGDAWRGLAVVGFRG